MCIFSGSHTYFWTFIEIFSLFLIEIMPNEHEKVNSIISQNFNINH